MIVLSNEGGVILLWSEDFMILLVYNINNINFIFSLKNHKLVYNAYERNCLTEVVRRPDYRQFVLLITLYLYCEVDRIRLVCPVFQMHLYNTTQFDNLILKTIILSVQTSRHQCTIPNRSFLPCMSHLQTSKIDI